MAEKITAHFTGIIWEEPATTDITESTETYEELSASDTLQEALSYLQDNLSYDGIWVQHNPLTKVAVHIKNIEWDTDGKDIDLPTTHTLYLPSVEAHKDDTVDELYSMAVADASDTHGWLITSCVSDMIELR